MIFIFIYLKIIKEIQFRTAFHINYFGQHVRTTHTITSEFKTSSIYDQDGQILLYEEKKDVRRVPMMEHTQTLVSKKYTAKQNTMRASLKGNPGRDISNV